MKSDARKAWEVRKEMDELCSKNPFLVRLICVRVEKKTRGQVKRALWRAKIMREYTRNPLKRLLRKFLAWQNKRRVLKNLSKLQGASFARTETDEL